MKPSHPLADSSACLLALRDALRVGWLCLSRHLVMAMDPQNQSKLVRRVERAAEAALLANKYVSSIDVLVGMGWLAHSHVDTWRQGRVEHLEQMVRIDPPRILATLEAFHAWAQDKGLKPSETVYVARTRDRKNLRFSASGDEEIERRYRTHYLSSELSECKQARLREKLQKPPDLVVIDPLREWECASCGGGEGLLIMESDKPLCMECADLDHLAWLPAGNAALTRRAKAKSGLSAVVVRFSRSRGRYERKGVLVEEHALEEAEAECMADETARERRRERDRTRREQEDQELVERMAKALLALFPGCPADEAHEIARHTAARGSGRVGRSAAGRALDEEALTLAAIARIRHRRTRYDEMLMSGSGRQDARDLVREEVQAVLDSWRLGPAQGHR